MTNERNSRRLCTVVAVALLAGAAATAHAHDPLRIEVHDDHYAIGELTFTDLDLMERAIKDSDSQRPLVFDVCSTGASRAFKAAAHRFRDHRITILVPARAAAECVPAARLMPASVAARPIGVDDGAVEAYWRSLMP